MAADLTIAVDFDGTIVTHEFPNIGRDIGAMRWLHRFKDEGAKVFLWTMRSGDFLTNAVDYCLAKGFEFDGHNSNPQQQNWTKSPKLFAHMYIDDAAVGCPLTLSDYTGERPYVDWEIVGPEVMQRMVLIQSGVLEF